MKTGGARGHFIKPVVDALEQAGYVLARRSTSHYIFKAPDRPNIIVPQILDSVNVAKKIVKAAGITL